MCGLSGIIDFSENSSDRMGRDLALMHAQIPHRGRNGEGFLVVDRQMKSWRGEALAPLVDRAQGPRVGFGFRWLAIQDLDPAAAQPMSADDGQLWIIFNGEIYNFIELREELERQGVAFRTQTDSEVVLAAYRQWGPDCLNRFEGMWAMLIVDLRRRRLFGSRDRFGIKPLFYRLEPDRVLFASELKELIAISGAQINEDLLYPYLHGHRGNLTDETFYRGLFAVPSASRFEIDLDGPAPPALPFENWWNLGRFSGMPRHKLGYADAAAELESILRNSVKLHIRAKVKVGSFLSGGLDSTLVTALIRDCSPEPHDSYTTVFDRSRYAEFDESNYVDDFVRHSSVMNFRATFDPEWIRQTIRHLTWIQEEPLIATTMFAQYRAFQTAREHGATVVLDGQGSDEIFGGYPQHEFTVWRERIMRGHVRDFTRESRILADHYRTSFPRMLYYQMARPAAGALVRRFRLRYARYPWIKEAFFKATRQKSKEDERIRRREINSFSSHLDRLMYSDIRYTSLPHLFNFSDRSAMAHSIEARLPYLDHRVVEFAMQLPPDFKAGYGRRKRILREVARRYLPASIVDRKDKMGFVTPESQWLRNGLHDDVLASLETPSMRALPFLDIDKAKEFTRAYVAGRHPDFRAVWRLHALRHWVEAFSLA